MKVKIRKLDKRAITPVYGKLGDAAMDLTSIAQYYDEYGNICYKTGISIEIPQGYVGLIFQRSSVCKYATMLTNAVGVIDSGYRGEILFKYKPTPYYHNKPDLRFVYEVGDKVGQIMIIPYPQIEFEEVEELSLSERGENGYGSTGN